MGSEEDAERKIQQGAEIYRAQPGNEGSPLILRTQSSIWLANGGKEGEDLRESLRGTGVCLAVEINGLDHTQAEYRNLIETLAEDNEDDGSVTNVYYDLDLGHIAESRYTHRHEHEGKQALAFYEDVLAESGKLVAATSLNQFVEEDTGTHKSLMSLEGSVNLTQVGHVLGEAVRQGRVSPEVLTVVEFSPFESETFLKTDGIIFATKFTEAFITAAGTTHSP